MEKQKEKDRDTLVVLVSLYMAKAIKGKIGAAFNPLLFLEECVINGCEVSFIPNEEEKGDIILRASDRYDENTLNISDESSSELSLA